MTITIDVASEKLASLARSLGEREGINQQISVELEGWVLRNFQAQGGLLGGWEPLSAATILSRIRKGNPPAGKYAAARAAVRGGARTSADISAAAGIGLFMILQDTGELRQSFAGFYDNNQAGVGAQSNAPHADLAAVHQFGTDRIPARPMLPTVEAALGIATAAYQRHIEVSREAVDL